MLSGFVPLQDELADIRRFVFTFQMLVDICVIDLQLERRHILIARVEEYILEQLLEDGVKPSCADIFCVLVCVAGSFGDRGDCALLKADHDFIYCQQRLVLLCKRVFGHGHDLFEVFLSLQGYHLFYNIQM